MSAEFRSQACLAWNDKTLNSIAMLRQSRIVNRANSANYMR